MRSYFTKEGRYIGTAAIKSPVTFKSSDFFLDNLPDDELELLKDGCTLSVDGDSYSIAANDQSDQISSIKKETEMLGHIKSSYSLQKQIVTIANAILDNDNTALQAMMGYVNPMIDEYDANGKDSDFSSLI